ncbi:inositol monophosphatase family protein [Buchnera aphidicola (Taiwanaphis decaspermi)]|uniref:inositol monophosphatase family protein n=1 Tax=Buchnera aphidicola TaxID=9 RepID=UPI0031B82051
MHPMLNVAISAIRKAGDILLHNYENINLENHDNIVNSIVLKKIINNVKNVIINVLNKFYPTHLFVNKNNFNKIDIKKGVLWVVNELNGKNNFVKKFPHFAISIAILVKGETKISVIYDPMKNELFTAVKGRGAQINGYRMRCSNNKKLSNNHIVFNNKIFTDLQIKNYFQIINKLCINKNKIKVTGSTLLNLSYIASGRIDICIHFSISKLILVTSELQVKESGGFINYLSSTNEFFNKHKNIIAGNSKIINYFLNK